MGALLPRLAAWRARRRGDVIYLSADELPEPYGLDPVVFGPQASR